MLAGILFSLVGMELKYCIFSLSVARYSLFCSRCGFFSLVGDENCTNPDYYFVLINQCFLICLGTRTLPIQIFFFLINRCFLISLGTRTASCTPGEAVPPGYTVLTCLTVACKVSPDNLERGIIFPAGRLSCVGFRPVLIVIPRPDSSCTTCRG